MASQAAVAVWPVCSIPESRRSGDRMGSQLRATSGLDFEAFGAKKSCGSDEGQDRAHRKTNDATDKDGKNENETIARSRILWIASNRRNQQAKTGQYDRAKNPSCNTHECEDRYLYGLT
jgi:hypothetical protein